MGGGGRSPILGGQTPIFPLLGILVLRLFLVVLFELVMVVSCVGDDYCGGGGADDSALRC